MSSSPSLYQVFCYVLTALGVVGRLQVPTGWPVFLWPQGLVTCWSTNPLLCSSSWRYAHSHSHLQSQKHVYACFTFWWIVCKVSHLQRIYPQMLGKANGATVGEILALRHVWCSCQQSQYASYTPLKPLLSCCDLLHTCNAAWRTEAMQC